MPAVAKYIVLALLFAALLIWRVDILLQQEASWTLQPYLGAKVEVAGTVADDPDVRSTSMRVTIAAAAVNGVAARGVLIASLPTEVQLSVGDRVVVYGTLTAPQNFTTSTGREFDYVNYLRVRGVSATMYYAQLRGVEPGGASLTARLFSLKHAFERALETVVPQPQVSLLEGIVLGERGGLSPALLQVFVVVGLIHVVVLSGSNISIVSEGVFRLLGSVLPRRAVYVLGVAAMLLFVLMTGGGAASLRALIMGGIAILARFMRRPVLALRSWCVAGAFMVLYDPLYVLDSGFVLSMLATFGLITISPSIEQRLRRVPAWTHFNLRSIVATTLGVELFILPALLYYQGVLSFVSVPLNALVLPIVPAIMLGGFVTGLLALVHPAAALVPGLATDLLLRAVILAAQAAAALPFAATTVGVFSAWVAVLVYAPLTWLALRTYARTPTN